MLRLVIIGKVTPSLNELMRTHFGARKRDSVDWAARILFASRTAGRESTQERAQGRRRLTIERHATRMLDADNLAGGCKDLIDQIRRLGLICDDRPELCELIFKQEKLTPKQKKHVVILLEDLP